MKTLSVIIPCYNELSTIRNIISKVSEVKIENWQIEIIIVDDGSKDGTREILKEYEKNLKIVYHEKNMGKGSAVQTGLAHASGEYILIQDADLEYNPSEIPSLIIALEKKMGTVIYGSRNLHHIKRKGMYIPRIGVWFITKEFNILYRTHLTDLWTCYKLFPKDASPLFTPGRFESELVFSAQLIKNNYSIAEVPISHKPRSIQEGKKIRSRDGIKGIYVLLKEYFK